MSNLNLNFSFFFLLKLKNKEMRIVIKSTKFEAVTYISIFINISQIPSGLFYLSSSSSYLLFFSGFNYSSIKK